MRWPPYNHIVLNRTKVPDLGDKRIISKFIWWPKKLSGQWRWLEYTKVVQQYQQILGPYATHHQGWVDIHWEQL